MQRSIKLTPDTTSYIASGWREKAAADPSVISQDLVRPIPLLEKLVQEGKLGRKSGEGFLKVSHLKGRVSTKLTESTRRSEEWHA